MVPLDGFNRGEGQVQAEDDPDNDEAADYGYISSGDEEELGGGSASLFEEGQPDVDDVKEDIITAEGYAELHWNRLQGSPIGAQNLQAPESSEAFGDFADVLRPQFRTPRAPSNPVGHDDIPAPVRHMARSSSSCFPQFGCLPASRRHSDRTPRILRTAVCGGTCSLKLQLTERGASRQLWLCTRNVKALKRLESAWTPESSIRDSGTGREESASEARRKGGASLTPQKRCHEDPVRHADRIGRSESIEE
ncbi:hypothetical protein L227DRAFT_568646 [Lentinus tigrinus ALCF2SS1-6]|uniref:Uncharacterized protein n=1 Tax=Lentinus tigrinus ALCF2SS1-6 TaxID=1328759 RepID=A0A5C2RL26_9APHY|nr:hypothetical protein L227DRAFT_568646 [Lentinus tigrinus ALCF2SS1-6]